MTVLSGYLIFLFSLSSSIFIYFQAPTQKLNRSWALFSLVVSVWGLGYAITGTVNDPEIALFFGRFHNLIAIFTPVTFLNFTYCFMDKDKEKRALLLSISIISSLYFIISLLFIDFFIPSVTYKLTNSFYINTEE
jgi:hypothetical protein